MILCAALLLCTALAGHAQIKISALPAATNAADADLSIIVQSNVTKRVPVGALRAVAATNILGFSNAVVAVAPPTTNASLLTAGTLDDARLSTNVARVSQLAATNIEGLGPFATATNLASTNILDFSNAVVAVSPPSTPTTNASLLVEGTLDSARLDTNVVLRDNTGKASASGWQVAAYAGAPSVDTNKIGLGWDALGRMTLQTPVGAFQFYQTGNPTTPTIYWPGTIVCQRFDAIYVNGSVPAANLSSVSGPIPAPLISQSTAQIWIIAEWQNPGANGVPYVVRNSMSEPTAGRYWPVAVAVTNADTNMPNTIAGAYLDEAGFAAAVVAVTGTNGLVTTNASLLTSGTLDDARLSTNVVLATNAALTNARPVAWVAAPAATNSAGEPGQIAWATNHLYICVGTNQWRRAQLGTW